MRSGGCNIQQSLTPEATTIVKQAINLARRRGHAQVTPIHVASVMLASPAGLLRAACLKSNSHPLQCKALELCFNVALNRLPTTSPAPILGPHSHYPALANALMAAFKRAQAHQRRGSIETQQQPILALKIETEQLVISILDDPSVSRVMREAGFSSTHVKSNVDHALSSLDASTQTNTTTTNTTTNNNNNNNICIKKENVVSPMIFRSVQNYQSPIIPLSLEVGFSNKRMSESRREEVSGVVESWVKRREKSSVVLVGECVEGCEDVVRGVKERVERGEVPLELRYVQFLHCSLVSMKNMSREEIELKLGEVRCFLKGCVGRGVVLYLGDLRWVAEYWAHHYNNNNNGEQRMTRHYYCPVEHLVMGLRRLVFGNVEFGRLWLMSVATFSTYIKCKTGNPCLETLLDLHPLTIPAPAPPSPSPAPTLLLDLSLKLESSLQGESNKRSLGSEGDDGNSRRWGRVEEDDEMKKLNCCPDCSVNCREEARSIAAAAGSIRNNESTTTTPTTSTTSSTPLPSWLQKYKDESRESSPIHNTNHQQDSVEIKELCRKWNTICSSTHKGTKFGEKIINFSSCSPSSSTSISSYENNNNNNPRLHETIIPSWPIMFEPKWSSKEHQFLPSNTSSKDLYENEPPKPELLSNPNSIPNSTSSSEATEGIFENPNNNNNNNNNNKLSFKENTPENLEALCSALEAKVPWQKDIIPEIATTILGIRSGIMSRKCKSIYKDKLLEKLETWLFFLGMDDEGKLKMGREIAKVVYGSYKSFKSIGLSSFSSTRADSNEDFSNKRVRDESGGGYLERFADLVKENPHRVLFVEDVDQIEQLCLKGMKRAIETGRIRASDGEYVSLEDAIVIFSCDAFSSGSRACSPPVKHKGNNDDLEECTSFGLPLDLNLSADYDFGSQDNHVADFSILEAVDKQVFFKINQVVL